MKKITPYIVATISLFAIAQAKANILSYSANNTVTTTGVTFSFNQFNPSLGTLSAVDLIMDSSVPGGYITLSRSSGNATFTRLDAGLSIVAGSDSIYEESPLKTLSATPATGNNTFTSTPKNFNLAPSQSLLSSTPYTQSIDSSIWGFFTGTGSALLDVELLAEAITSTNVNVTKNYNNFTALTFLTLQYTYTTDPAPIPEPGQVAASLLLLGGIGAYVFIKRRKKSAPAAA